jgi:peptidylprolyl isomerase
LKKDRDPTLNFKDTLPSPHPCVNVNGVVILCRTTHRKTQMNLSFRPRAALLGTISSSAATNIDTTGIATTTIIDKEEKKARTMSTPKFVFVLVLALFLVVGTGVVSYSIQPPPPSSPKKINTAAATKTATTRRNFLSTSIVTTAAGLVVASSTTTAAVAAADNDDQEDDGFITTESGLKYKVIKEPAAGGAIPTPGQTVRAHYTGWLDGFDSDKKFDSSRDRGRAFTFKVGAGQVIRGWDESFATMAVGERRLIILPPRLGYGDRGAGGIIPGGATLYFDVELLSIL